MTTPSTPYTYRQAFSNGEPCGYVVQHGTANPLFDVEDEEQARRVVACLNACDGIATETLEGGLVSELVAACGGVNWLRLNRANYGTPDWLEFFDAAATDAGDAYRKATEPDF